MKKGAYAKSVCEMKKRSSRSVLRAMALYGLHIFCSTTGLLRKAINRPRVHILALHHLFPDEEVHFHKLLKWLLETGHRFIAYSEAIRRISEGDIDAPYVAFSFDDGFHSCLQAGRILRKYGASACFFLNGFILENNGLESTIQYCRERMRNMPTVRFLAWPDARALVDIGHEIGDHTYSHINMATSDVSAIQRELERNRETLRGHLGEIRHFAWPGGTFKHFSFAAKEIVFKMGYESCASGVRGCHIVGADTPDYCVRREHIVASWPLTHVACFLTRSALRADNSSHNWEGLL